MADNKRLEGKKVLLVEDEQIISRMYGKRFAEAGIHMVPAYSGREAIKILKEETVDMILLDLGMPGMDGFETLMEIKKIEQAKDTPIIILSNTTMDKTRAGYKEIQEAGVKDIFRKYESPLSDIVEKITEYLA